MNKINKDFIIKEYNKRKEKCVEDYGPSYIESLEKDIDFIKNTISSFLICEEDNINRVYKMIDENRLMYVMVQLPDYVAINDNFCSFYNSILGYCKRVISLDETSNIDAEQACAQLVSMKNKAIEAIDGYFNVGSMEANVCDGISTLEYLVNMSKDISLINNDLNDIRNKVSLDDKYTCIRNAVVCMYTCAVMYFYFKMLSCVIDTYDDCLISAGIKSKPAVIKEEKFKLF